MLKVENLTSQLQEHIFSCVTEDNLVMIVTLTIAAFFFFFSRHCLLLLCPFLVVLKNRYLPKQMYVSDKSQEECLLDHRKFPVQEEILGTSCGAEHCGPAGRSPFTAASIN